VIQSLLYFEKNTPVFHKIHDIYYIIPHYANIWQYILRAVTVHFIDKYATSKLRIGK